MDNVFLLTLFFIFATTFISTYVSRLIKDRCLSDFADFDTTLELKNGDRFWGRLNVFSSGLEVVYDAPRAAEDEMANSAIFLADRLGNLQAVYRFHDELNQENQERRQADILSSYHPALHQQMLRSLSNFVSTFRDAISESIGFVVSRVKAGGGGSAVVQTQDAQLTKMGRNVVDTGARHAFEPVLERYIGRRVIAEELRPNEQIETHGGILKDYTANWIELLDCHFTRTFDFNLSEPRRLRLNRNIDFTLLRRQDDDANGSGLALRIGNFGSQPLTVQKLEAENFTQGVERLVAPGASTEFPIDPLPEALQQAFTAAELPTEVSLRSGERETRPGPAPKLPVLPSLTISIHAPRQGDICLPRAHAYIKHGAEPAGSGWVLENWRELRAWSSQHSQRAMLRLAWILFNALLAFLVGLDLFGWIWDFTPGVIFLSLLTAVVAAAVWLTEWSAVVRGKTDFARRQRRRLWFATAGMILFIALSTFFS